MAGLRLLVKPTLVEGNTIVALVDAEDVADCTVSVQHPKDIQVDGNPTVNLGRATFRESRSWRVSSSSPQNQESSIVVKASAGALIQMATVPLTL